MISKILHAKYYCVIWLLLFSIFIIIIIVQFLPEPLVYQKIGDDQTTVSPIGPSEVPPPYQQIPQGGVPMVTCRVCQAMIDISSKREQHVVKCHQCQEATVIESFQKSKNILKLLFFSFFQMLAYSKCTTGQKVCTMSMQLFAHM